ncbi:uncharacterized protein BJ171DRAFT_457661 [Polychytrium aggregatum]|uniref:uncharacterized protein n=1 Tax=Polychytrium aggregatum TaxID=110093 RepID=UPI0022FE1587|nr:uncharacterized protein BJ171DRAFT_457661 [Polychytrium aggregatum]KAI9206058.1 hypothetical protein BJ171DRAFT_457661 [Polychytrium aggregatum]
MSNSVRGAIYSNVPVWEIRAKNIPVMRRQADGYINATQILRAAGLTKPQRTRILERDVVGGTHEKVQGGYHGFQGTWIPLERAKSLANEYALYTELEPLLSYDAAPLAIDPESEAKRRKKLLSTPSSPLQSLSPGPMEAGGPSLLDSPTSSRRSARAAAYASRGFARSQNQENIPPLDSSSTDDEPSLRSHSHSGLFVSSSGQSLRLGGRDVDHVSAIISVTPATPTELSESETTDGPVHPAKVKRFCSICHTTDTPQWRRSPVDGSTLCNACGVRPYGSRVRAANSRRSDSSDVSSHEVESASPSRHSRYQSANSTSSVPGTAGPAPPTDPYQLEREILQLRQSVTSSERDRKKMVRVLNQIREQDRARDASFRRIISKCKAYKIHKRRETKMAEFAALYGNEDCNMSDDDDDSMMTDHDDQSDDLEEVDNHATQSQLQNSFLDAVSKFKRRRELELKSLIVPSYDEDSPVPTGVPMHDRPVDATNVGRPGTMM